MKMPVYHQLDLRIDKVWYFNKWRLGFYLDIQNLYNYKAAGQEILMPEIGADGQYVPDPNKPGHYKMQHIAHDIGGNDLADARHYHRDVGPICIPIPGVFAARSFVRVFEYSHCRSFSMGCGDKFT